MKRLLIFFGVLDALLCLRFTSQIIAPFRALFSGASLIALADSSLRAAFVISLIFSAYGFIRTRRWAFVLSYIQFPFRFVFVLLSFGFLSLASRLTDTPGIYQPLIVSAMVLEVARLAITIAAHYGRTIRSSELPAAGAAGSRSP